jgi:hypothetical protein
VNLKHHGSNAGLLVCSVYAGGERDGFWLNLQRRQLQSTCESFDHAVFLGRRANCELFNDCIVVGRSTLPRLSFPAEEHLQGMRALTDYCRAHRYEGYLILDSDAFPVAPDWERILLSLLHRFHKQCAAVVRTENLDTFAHPCVVYATDASVLRFEFRTSTTLMGETVKDVTCTSDYLPLLRTNAAGPHPVLASIYLNLFYHHGCGSRGFRMRSTHTGYYDHILPRADTADDLFQRLQGDPQSFLARLMVPEAIAPANSGVGKKRRPPSFQQRLWGALTKAGRNAGQ